jgi:YidC/Oxa1 family membrane protein insertase
MNAILPLASIFQPFENLSETIIKFFEGTIGLSWGISIIALTFTVRCAVLPLSLTGIRSMRRLQILAPRMKEINEKYKNDPERKQRELMEVYKENNVNPFSSCLPFIIQIPFFIGIYQLLRSTGFTDDVTSSGASQSFLFVNSIIEKPTGAEAIVLIILFFVTTALSLLYTTATNPAAASGAQRYIFLIFPVLFAPFIATQPAGLGVYWIATNVWSLGQQMVVQKIMPAPKPPTEEEREAAKAPPPPPPRKKKKRK